MDHDLRCGNCNYWLGESTVHLVRVGVVPRGSETKVQPPRDLRLCKGCGQVTVFLPLAELERRLDAA